MMSVDIALAPECEPYTSFRKAFFALKAERDVLAAAKRADNNGGASDCVDFQAKPNRSLSLAPHAQRRRSSSRRDTRSDAGAQQQEHESAGTCAARGRSPGIQTTSLANQSLAPHALAADPQPFAKASTWLAAGYQAPCSRK